MSFFVSDLSSSEALRQHLALPAAAAALRGQPQRALRRRRRFEALGAVRRRGNADEGELAADGAAVAQGRGGAVVQVLSQSDHTVT